MSKPYTRLTIIALLIAASSTALACPPPGPCNKKYKMGEAQVSVYRREGVARPPAKLTPGFLVGSRWLPVSIGAGHAPRVVRFASPALPPNARSLPERIVLVRRLELRRGVHHVEIDGAFYTLTTCLDDARQTTSCLNLVGALPPP